MNSGVKINAKYILGALAVLCAWWVFGSLFTNDGGSGIKWVLFLGAIPLGGICLTLFLAWDRLAGIGRRPSKGLWLFLLIILGIIGATLTVMAPIMTLGTLLFSGGIHDWSSAGVILGMAGGAVICWWLFALALKRMKQ
jgi:hypothetical protein